MVTSFGDYTLLYGEDIADEELPDFRGDPEDSGATREWMGEVVLSSTLILPNSPETGAVNNGASLRLHATTVSGQPLNVLMGGIGAR